MMGAGVINLLLFLSSVSLLALMAGVAKKLVRGRNERKIPRELDLVGEKVERIIPLPPGEFEAALEGYALDAAYIKHGRLAALDEYLLGVMEQPPEAYADRYVAIARRMGFYGSALAQIRSRNPLISSLGSRRAGLYRFEEAAEDMVAALDAFSSENQFDILMGLARMGNAGAMRQAFQKIKNSVFINERSIIEILSVFPAGAEKTALFRDMILGDTGYITSLFLKAADREMAASLPEEITAALGNGNKELRAAAIRCLSTMGEGAPVGVLVNAMQDKSWEIRALAAKALGSITEKESSMALFAALSDQQWWVRQNAAMSLMRHPGYEKLFILIAESGDEYSRDSIIYALENGGSPILLRSIKVLAG